MIDVLIAGTLFRAAEAKISKNGRAFVAAAIRETAGNETRWIKVFAFSETAQTELMRLVAGDAVSLQGPLRATTYTTTGGAAKVDLSVVANLVLALRQPPRERKANPANLPALLDTRSRAERCAGQWTAGSGDPDDGIPFGGDL